MQAIPLRTKVEIGEEIRQGGYNYAVRAVERIQSQATKRVTYVHWCEMLEAADMINPIVGYAKFH